MGSERARTGLGIALLLGLVVVLYWQRGHTFFILDDLFFIVEDPHMHPARMNWEAILQLLQGAHPEAARRPLHLLTLMLDWWRSGGNPGAFYFTNVGLHGLNAVLVFLLARKIFLATDSLRPASVTLAAFFAGALWAAHPIHLTAVAYFWQRAVELAALGVLAALILYLYGRTTGNARARILCLGASAVCWVLASLSKENAWIGPALAALLEIGVVRHRAPAMLAHRSEKRGLALLVVAAGLVCISIALGVGPVAGWLERGYRGWDFTLEQRLLTEPAVVVFYLSQLFWPAPGRFAIEHDFILARGLLDPPATILALGFIGLWAGTALALLAKAGKRLHGALLLFPLLALAMESSVVPIDIVFEYRMYLPSVGLAILAALGLARLPRSMALAGGAALVAILAFCQAAYLRQWNSPFDLYEQAARLAPTSARVQYNFGNRLLEKGRYEEALAHYQRIFAIASPSVNRLGTIKMEAVYFNQALALLRLGRVEEAMLSLENATRAFSGHLKAHAFLVDLYLQEGKADQALRHLDELLRLDPSNQSARQLRQQLALTIGP